MTAALASKGPEEKRPEEIWEMGSLLDQMKSLTLAVLAALTTRYVERCIQQLQEEHSARKRIWGGSPARLTQFALRTNSDDVPLGQLRNASDIVKGLEARSASRPQVLALLLEWLLIHLPEDAWKQTLAADIRALSTSMTTLIRISSLHLSSLPISDPALLAGKTNVSANLGAVCSTT